MEPYEWKVEYQFLEIHTQGSNLEGSIATDCNPNSRAKEVFHLIIVAPSVTAKVEAL